MRIGLIDVDSHNFPNLALMKISGYHKAKGDEVEWYMPFNDRYDIVYVSKVFGFTEDYDLVINADKVIRGGTGYAISLVDGVEIYDKTKDFELPNEIEHHYPDYSIYPQYSNTAYGYITRGCPRGCGFCIVGKKEGKKTTFSSRLNEFWRGEKNIVLLDPNILAYPDRISILQELKKTKSYVDFCQGLDIRMIDREVATLLGQIKMKEVHFAWDRMEDKDIIIPKLELFKTCVPKLFSGHHAVVYMIVNYSTTFEEDLERVTILRDMGYNPYVMIYDKEHCQRKYKDLQRWVNNRIIFSKCATFKDYNNEKNKTKST